MHEVRGMRNEEVLEGAKRLIALERKGQAEFLVYLAEVETRKLYLPEHSSLFGFCMNELGLSEPSTSKRIQVSRCAVKFPVILEHIARNELTLTNVSLLAPHVTEANHLTLINGALRKPKREVERLVATHFPKPDVVEAIRKLPEPRTFAGECAPVSIRPERVEPLTATRTKFEFSADEKFVEVFRQVQARMRRKFPAGRIEDLAREAFQLLLEKTDPAREPERKVAARPSRHTRRPPASVSREVWRKDGERCTFTSHEGAPCEARAFLELDHIVPWSLGGTSRDAGNLTVRCRAHNAWRGGARAATP